MFQRFVAMLLSTCLLAGSVPETAYAMAESEGKKTETVMEMEEGTGDEEESEPVEETKEEKEEMSVTTEETTLEDGEASETIEDGETLEDEETSETVEETASETVEDTEESEAETVIESEPEEAVTEIDGETVQEETEIAVETEETSEIVKSDTTTDVAPKATLKKEADGTYKAEYGGYTVKMSLNPGYKSIIAKFALTFESSVTPDAKYKIEYEIINSLFENEIDLYEFDDYTSTLIQNGLASNTEYQLTANLVDSNGELIAVLVDKENAIDFKTMATEAEEAVLELGEITYKSAELKCEAFYEGMRGYYAPVNNLEKKQSFYLYDGWNSYTLKELDAATTYRVWVADRDGIVCEEKTFTTKELSLNAQYEIEQISNLSFQINANVSEYNGDSDSLYLCLQFTDESDEVQKRRHKIELSGEEGKKTGSGSYYFSDGLLANTTYPIDMWIQEEEYTDVHYAKETQEITTKSGNILEEDVTFSVAQNKTMKTSMDYTIEIKGLSTLEYATISYRLKGENIWHNESNISITDAIYTGTLTDLQEGMEYEVKIYLHGQGIRKVASCQMGEARFTPQLSDDTDIFDAVLKYQLKTDSSLDGCDWHVAIYYKEEADEKYELVVDKELTAQNGYKQELKTADYMFLKPGTAYSFCWELYKLSDRKKTRCHTAYQTIQTKNSDVTAKANVIAMNSAEYTISTDARSENLTEQTLLLYPYISEAGGEYKCIDNKYVYLFGEYYGNSYKVSFNNLKKNTDYTISLRDESGETEYAKFSFTTLADDLDINIEDILYYTESVVFTVEAEGTAINGSDYLHLYYREKGCEKWESDIKSLNTEGAYSFIVEEYAGKPLKECTLYEYELGVGETYSTARINLTHKKTGEFKTIRDDRTLVLKRVVPHLDYAEFELEISGEAAENFDNNVVLYYREKGTEEWKSDWETKRGTGELVAVLPNFYDNLKKETTYEYVVGLGRKYNSDMDSLTQVIEGEFTTCVDDRSLDVSINPGTYRAEVLVNLTGKAAETENTCVVLYYKEKGSEKEWESVSCVEYMSKGTAVLDITTFGGDTLKEETVYEYVAGIGSTTSTLRSELTQTVSGEFVTEKDGRTLEISGCQAGYGTALTEIKVNGNESKEQTNVYSFYREKGTDEWKSGKSDSGVEKSFRVQMIFGTEEELLKQDTEYEYLVVLPKKSKNIVLDEDMPEEQEYVRGSFKTKKSGYTLDIVTDEAKTTYKTAVLNVTAKDSSEDEKIAVTLSFDNGLEKKITLYRKNHYKSNVLLNELEQNTEYTLRQAEISANENGCEPIIAKLTPEVHFTTKKIVIPSSITLSQEKIFLNGESDVYETYCQKLRATILPQNAAKDIVWSSSDIFVAGVTQDGVVYANGEGTAVITAKSVYDENVQTSCEVTVKNYVVGKSENSTVNEVTGVQNVYKGEAVNGLGLYERTKDDTLAPVKDYQVTAERSGIVSWENGKLVGKAVGTTTVFFEKDGIKAAVKVKVLTKTKGFGIVGLEASNTAYPAVCKAEGSYEIACADGLSYSVQGKISYAEEFQYSDFNWVSSDETVATITNGKIEPKKPGKVTITVTPKEKPSPYIQDKAELKLIVKELPIMKESTVYALTNLKKKMLLSDVDLEEALGEGWEWKNPKTPLYSLPTNTDSYPFEVVYTGKDRYPCEAVVNVYIGTIKKVTAVEKYDDHNQVIQVCGEETEKKDEIRLQIMPEYTGTLTREIITEIPSVKGLHIEWEEATDSFLITASKKGSYTLKPKVSIVTKDRKGQEIVKTIITGTYKLKAVEGVQADSITLSTDTEGIAIDERTGTIELDLSNGIKNKEISLTAIVKDSEGNEIKTPLEWKISDKTVAAVKGNKKDSHQATLTIKGNSGHTVVTVKAKDATGCTARLDLEVRDHRPRVNKTKANINLAYEYENSSGRNLAAAAGGKIEIAEVYGERIESVALYKEDKKTLETDIAIWYFNSDVAENYLLKPAKEEIATGIYHCQLAVKTEKSDELYFYPLQITVENNAPKVTAKMSKKVNLFYRTKPGNIFITVAGENEGVENVTWEDNSAEIGNGFEVYYSWTPDEEKEKKYLAYVYSEQVKVKNGKPDDSKIGKGTLKVKLAGVREPVEIKNFKMGYSYQKPTLKTVSGTTKVVPKTGSNSNSFKIYDNVSKEYLTYYEGESYKDYNEIRCDNEAVEISAEYSEVNYIYNGSKKQEKITLTLQSEGWREPLSVKHTIQAVEPKAYLSDETLVYNTAYENEVGTSVKIKNCSDTVELTDVVIKGTNAKAQALVNNDILQIVQGESETTELMVRMDRVSLTQKKVAAGTYTFQLKPYYHNAVTGEKTALNTLKLKIQVVTKPVTAKIHTKGTLDLVKTEANGLTENSVCLKPKFTNLPDGCRITDARLTGEYSKYFKLERETFYEEEETNSLNNYYYLKVAQNGKVKAKQKYNLTIVYTIVTKTGETLEVAGNFKVTPKQTVPKVTVEDNNQIMYAASEEVRTCKIYVPEGYAIKSAYGSVDCNKDGKADIEAKASEGGESSTLYITITDKNAVSATVKGKRYSIPITVQLKGCDGVSKDAKTNINVKVKR